MREEPGSEGRKGCCGLGGDFERSRVKTNSSVRKKRRVSEYGVVCYAMLSQRSTARKRASVFSGRGDEAERPRGGGLRERRFWHNKARDWLG